MVLRSRLALLDGLQHSLGEFARWVVLVRPILMAFFFCRMGAAGPSAIAAAEPIEYVRVQAPAGKKISVMVRIEPKVIFATERTFLVRRSSSLPLTALRHTDGSLFGLCFQRWLEISVLIGTIATTLLNFKHPHDRTGLIVATVFTLAALTSIAYSGVMFVRRALSLRRREANVTGVYYDKIGPTILVFILGGAVITNVVLRMTELWDS